MDALGLYILLLTEKAAGDKARIKSHEGKTEDFPGQYEQETAYERGSWHALTYAADIAKTYLRGRDPIMVPTREEEEGA